MGQIKINTSHSLWVMVVVYHRLTKVKNQDPAFCLVFFVGKIHCILSDEEQVCLDTELLRNVKLCLVNLHLNIGSRRIKTVCLRERNHHKN